MTRARETMTDEVIKKIIETVRLGVPPDIAAQIHKINPSTMRSFKHSNAQFREDIEQANGQACMTVWGSMLQGLTTAPWQQKAWMLERRWPEHFSRREVVRHEIGEDDTAASLVADIAAIRRRDLGVVTANNGDADTNGTS